MTVLWKAQVECTVIGASNREHCEPSLQHIKVKPWVFSLLTIGLRLQLLLPMSLLKVPFIAAITLWFHKSLSSPNPTSEFNNKTVDENFPTVLFIAVQRVNV